MVNKKTMTRAKEPIKIWAKPLKNGNKALYLRRYIAHTQSKGKAEAMQPPSTIRCYTLLYIRERLSK